MSDVANQEKLVSILDILKSYEPSGWADGRPMGYDLATDNRTEFGFYWEYDQMEEAAKQISDLIREEKASLLKEILFEHNSLIEVIHGHDRVTRPTDRTGEEILRERLTTRLKELTENE